MYIFSKLLSCETSFVHWLFLGEVGVKGPQICENISPDWGHPYEENYDEPGYGCNLPSHSYLNIIFFVICIPQSYTKVIKVE